jgi:MFS superfamily sulfate permease-like transporter
VKQAGARGIALISFIESIAAARSFNRPHDAQPVPNGELIARGPNSGMMSADSEGDSML